MTHTDNEASQQVEKLSRHQHSASVDQRLRALVPMWDSSDPERAPPPLPLNPQSPKVTTRIATSSAIQSAHAALNERARESAVSSHASATRRLDGSPERQLIKSGAHRRMQSLQPGSVRDLSWMIEQGSSRPCTPTDSITSPHPTPGPSLTPIVRPTARRHAAQQSILGENTPPPSSTILALQTMSPQSPTKAVEPLSNITNGAASPDKSNNSSLDAVSSQLLSLTSIATALQREMTALTRRSRDNATDLLSLKEATSTRDEDIRRSIRELVGQVNDQNSRLSLTSLNGLLLDNKPHPASPPNRSIHLPRIPSPKSFAESIDRGSVSTPSLTGGEASASLLLLEKILRGMGTADGEQSLVSLLMQLSQRLSGMATSAKVDELAQYVRHQAESAIVRSGPNSNRTITSSGMELDISRGPMAKRVEQLIQSDGRGSSTSSGRGAELVNEDLLQIIRSVKDSVAQGGGLTAEVKALVRELRGEVLGMGREIAKRLETMDSAPRGEDDGDSERKEQVSRVIDQGLLQMKEQLNLVLREHRRQSASSSTSQKTVVDYQEIYMAMRAALRDNEATRGETPDLSREDVIEAVRQAWEAYKPEIDVGRSAIERDEIMACLKEGLQDYQPQDERPPAATRDEVFTAVVEGLKHFVPPQVDTPASLSRDEIIEAVRDCLEEFEFPVAASAIGHGNDMTHQDVVHAVKEGLSGFEVPRAGSFSSESNGEIMSRLQDIMQYMKLEFRAVSDEAKDNVAASGRDTEQVLDATKDGLENLRVAIESYVDRATGESGNREFMHHLLEVMEDFKQNIGNLVSGANDSSQSQLQSELESIREMVNTSMVPTTPQGTNKELLEALHNGINSLRQDIHRPRADTGEILDAINDGLNDLRVGIDRIANKPVDLTANDEILDALKAGLDSVRIDIETLRDSSNERAVAAVPREMVEEEEEEEQEDPTKAIILPMNMAKQDDIKHLEVLITQLRIKVEAMEPDPETVQKEDIARLEEMLRNVQQGVDTIHARDSVASCSRSVEEEEGKGEKEGDASASGDTATKDDVVAIETILRNTKDRLDELIDGDQAVRKDHIDAVSDLINENKETIVGAFSGHFEGMLRKEDVDNLEELIAQVIIGIDDVKNASSSKEVENDETVTKSDVEAIEARVLEIKVALDGLSDMDFAAISNKDDVSGLELLIKEAKQKLDEYAEVSTKALEERQVEIVGVGERVSQVKTFLEEFQEAVQTKLDDGATGVETLGKILEGIGEKIDKNENVSDDLKDMFETMKSEFEVSKEIVAGARLESDEKLQEATDNIASKIEEKIGELISKYDDYQAQLDEKAKAGEERTVEIEATLVSTKTVSEEVKLLVDTLGSTVTESLEKMEEASKTVFEKVEELASKTTETEEADKMEHQQTRDQVQAAVSAVVGLEDELKEYQPQILEAVKKILDLVGEHYEHSKSSATEIQDKIVEGQAADQAMLPPPVEKYNDSEMKEQLKLLADHRYDDSEVKEQLRLLADQRYDDSEIREKLDRLADEKYDDSEVKEKLDRLAEQKFDDSYLHEKLDKLADYNSWTVSAFAKIATLDVVHETVREQAAKLSEFLANQTRRIADEEEDREKTLQDTCLALERKLAEQELLTASVASLQEEEERVRQSVLKLQTEQESLIRQRTRLTGDVSSLETALRLRREELSEMEARAEGLERRIVESVMDHSRVLLMSKKSACSGLDQMKKKRVKKPMESEREAKLDPRPVVNMALSTRRSPAPALQKGATRRIVSLSQMMQSSSSLAVKRSQSVRTVAGGLAHRKRSWGVGVGKGFDVEDKENVGVEEMLLEEVPEVSSRAVSQERELQAEDSKSVADAEQSWQWQLDSTREEDEDEAEEEDSDADTMRRTSGGTTIVSGSDLCTESDVYSEYDDDDTESEWTETAVGTASLLEDEVQGNEMVLHGGRD